MLCLRLTDLSSGRIVRFGGARTSVEYDYDSVVSLHVRRSPAMSLTAVRPTQSQLAPACKDSNRGLTRMTPSPLTNNISIFRLTYLKIRG